MWSKDECFSSAVIFFFLKMNALEHFFWFPFSGLCLLVFFSLERLLRRFSPFTIARKTACLYSINYFSLLPYRLSCVTWKPSLSYSLTHVQTRQTDSYFGHHYNQHTYCNNANPYLLIRSTFSSHLGNTLQMQKMELNIDRLLKGRKSKNMLPVILSVWDICISLWALCLWRWEKTVHLH